MPQNAVHVMGPDIGGTLIRGCFGPRLMAKVVDVLCLSALVAHDPLDGGSGRKPVGIDELEGDVAALRYRPYPVDA